MRTRSLSIGVALLILCLNPAFLAAQSVSFAGAQTTVAASGLSNPYGVAVDGAGNVFIADQNNNRVVEVPSGGGAQTTVGSGLNQPTGVAVDGAGNVFIADNHNNRVVKVPAGGGAQTTIGSGLYYPQGVAVDGAGNVFIADTYNSRVVEVPAGGGAQTTVPASGLLYPTGVAVDGAGDVFIADNNNSRVVEVPAGGGAQITVGSGLYYPFSVAVDGAGDVFIADTDNSRVVEVPAGGGPQITVGNGLNLPYGVTVDGAGDIYIADTYNNQVVEVQRVAVKFGNVNVCPAGQSTPAPCNQTIPLNYNVVASTTFGTIKVVTQGAPNLDFTLGSGSTCTGTVAAGSPCTVNVTFAPLAPGVRMAAVQLSDNLGNLVTTTMIRGIGQGPAIAFSPGVQTTVPASGLNNVLGVAVDAAGDVFIADTYNSRVVEVPAAGGPQTTVGTGLCAPTGVAVDGAGNVFIADYCNLQVVEVPANGSPQTIVPVSGLSYPHGVAVDGAGNVFITDFFNARVVEVTPSGVQTTVPASGLSEPIAVAVDGAGDVFIADPQNNRVVEVPAGCTNAACQTTVGSGLAFPSGVAVDGAGDVFIGDYSNSRVVEVTPSGVQTTLPASGLSKPFGVAVDGAGDVFIGDRYNNRVVEVQRSQPPVFSFATTVMGFTSSDSPQSMTIQNVGNQALNAIAPGLVVGGPNFLQVAGLGTPADCTNNFSLAPGESCNLSISFDPQSVGNLTAAATFTDNALNTIPRASQNIALQGIGQATQTGLGQTITFTQPAPASANYYSAFTVSAASTSGLTVTLTVDASSASVCSLGASSVASGVTSTIVAMQSATGTCTIDANQAGSGIYDAAAQQQTSATATTAIIGGTLTVTNTNDSGFGSLRDAIANAVSGDTINFDLASPATITLASTLAVNTSLTISGPGASNVAISGNHAVQVFSIGGGITANISGVTIENGNVNGGGIWGGVGAGGIYNAGTLTLSNSTVFGNTVSADGDGYYVSVYGGGIYNTGTLTLSNSTISGNTATGGGNDFYGGVTGGGIFNSGTLTLSNSTISGNTADGGGNDYYGSVSGGGIYNAGTLMLSNNTISGNSTVSANAFFGSVSGGGIYNAATLTAKNNIVANSPSGGNCAGTITSEGYNLSDDASCAASFTQTGDRNRTAAGLDPSGLQANGGSTQTIALLSTSPAVDAVLLSPINYCTDTNGNAVTTDQRGVTRPQGSACDIGAFEFAQSQAGQTSQTVSFTQAAPGTAAYNSTFSVAAQATSGLTVTLSLDSGSTTVCSLGAPIVVGGVTSATVTMLSGTGSCTIFAIQSGNATYSAAAPQQTSAAAQPSGQTISFTQAAPSSASYRGLFTVAAQSTSGLTIALSVDASSTSVCSLGTASVAGGVTNAIVTVLSTTGTCTIDANQAGNSNYNAATQQETSAVIAALSPSMGDVAVDVGNSTIGKLKATDGTISWSASVINDGAIAVDQLDFGVYTGYGSHNFSLPGTVYKLDSSGAQVWSSAISTGGCNFYYVNNVAVDATSASPGVVWTEAGCYGGMAKSSRTDGAQLWAVFTDDIGRASIDPSNGQIYAITDAGPSYGYNTLYSATATGSLTSASSCEGYTDLNPADGTFYRGGNTASNGCGLVLYQMNKNSLGSTNWSMDLSGYIASFDALAVQPWSGGYIFVASASSSEIVVVDPTTQTVVRTFTTAVTPNNIAVNPSGGNVYVTDSASHFVYAYSPTGSLMWTSPDLGGPVYNIAAPRGVVGAPVGASQTISFGALSDQVFGSAPFTLSATASSALAVSFASTTSTVCTVSGATVTLVAVGTCTIQATQAGNVNYAAATPVNQSFQVTQGSQTITFAALSNQAFGSAPFTVSGTASSGLAVSFASTTSTVCTVSGATVTLVAVGTCTIQATQAGNVNYAAATPVNQSFQVTQGSQTITFGALSNQVFGSAPFAVTGTASSGLAVSFGSTTSGVCTVSGATVTLVSAGTCTIQATQAGNGNYAAAPPVNQSFQVTPASQTITFGALSNRVFGSAPFTVSGTASSGLAVSFASTTSGVCTASGTTVTLVSVGTCTIQATQAGNGNYNAAPPVNQSFQVTPESQTITFGALSNQVFGTAPFTVSGTASSGLAVSFASTTSVVCTASGATVTLVAVGTCTIQATQAGNGNYAAATPVSQSFLVTQGSQSITFGALSNQAFGSAPFTVSGTASSGLAVSFASTTPAVCTVSSVTVTVVAVGTCTIQATQAGNANYTAAPPVNQSFQVAPESQTITFGALSNRLLGSAPFTVSASASSGLAVTFNSTTSAVCTASSATVTTVAAGACTIQATQAGNANYAAATPINQTFQVNPADFTLASNPTTATVAAGRTGTFTLTVTPQGSFTSAISFSCSGLPTLAGCTFSPATLTPNTSTVTTTLTITTAGHSASLAAPPLGRRSNPLYAIWLVLPAMLLGTVGIAAPKRRKLLSCCLAFLLLGGCLLQVACGGSSGGGGTPTGSYTVTVTAGAGSTQHPAVLTLIVQ